MAFLKQKLVLPKLTRDGNQHPSAASFVNTKRFGAVSSHDGKAASAVDSMLLRGRVRTM